MLYTAASILKAAGNIVINVDLFYTLDKCSCYLNYISICSMHYLLKWNCILFQLKVFLMYLQILLIFLFFGIFSTVIDKKISLFPTAWKSYVRFLPHISSSISKQTFWTINCIINSKIIYFSSNHIMKSNWSYRADRLYSLRTIFRIQ